MKGKQLLILTLIAAILTGLAMFLSTKRPAHSGVVVGKKVLPSLRVNDIQALEISSASETVTVTRTDGIWRVVNRHNYPADFGKIRDLLTKLADLKVLQSVRATVQQRRELHLLHGPAADASEQPTVLNMKDAAGQPVETLLLGKERIRPSASPDPSPYGNFPDGRFIATGKGKIFLVGDTLTEAVTAPRSWMEDELLSIKPEDIASIEVNGATNGTIMLTRTNGNASFTLPEIPDGKVADESSLTRLSSSLSYLRFEDIADPSAAMDSTGLEKPVTFIARTFNGAAYTVSVGRSAAPDRKYYARFSVSFSSPLPSVAADSSNRIDKAQVTANEKLAADTKRLAAKLTPWTYILNAYTAESFTMGYGNLLKDKPKPAENKTEASE